MYSFKDHKRNQESSNFIKCHMKGDVILGDVRHQFAY